MKGFGAIVRALVIRPALRERGRTLLTISGIAVGIAVVVAIQLSNQSALRSFEESVEAIAGRANLQMVSDAGMLDERLLSTLEPEWRRGLRFAPVIDLDGSMIPEGVPIRILAVDLVSDLHFRDYRFARIVGSAAETIESMATFTALFRTDSAILPDSFARRHGLVLGDAIHLNLRGQTRRFVVRGILRSEGPATAFQGSLVILDIATAQTAFDLTGRLTRVDLLVPESEASLILKDLTARLPPSIRLERPSRRSERVAEMLRAFRVNLFALASVSLLVGIFLVYNTVLVSILRRRSQIGILKTVGAAPGQIFAAFLLEGALFGLLGSLLGIFLGYGLARSTLGLIARTINALYFTTAPTRMDLDLPIILSAITTGVAISVLSALHPAAEASRIRPILIVREGRYQRGSRGLLVRLSWLALVAFALALASSRIPPLGGISAGGYLSVLFVIAGFSLLSAIGLQQGSRFLRPLFRRVDRVAGDLAAASLPASLRRASIAAAALTIAIGMMVAVSLMIGSFRTTVEEWVGQTVRSDLWVRPSRSLSNAAATFPPSILGELRDLPSIRAVDPFRGREVLLGEQSVLVGSGELQVILDHGALPMITPRSFRTAVQEALEGDGVIVSESFAYRFGRGRGDEIVLPAPAGSRAFPITGVYRDYSTERGVVVMDRDLFLRTFEDEAIDTIAVFLHEGVDPEVARREIDQRLGPAFHAFTFTNRTVRAEVMKIFDQTFLITYALLIIALTVAVLGIVNTLSALILERRRELALLRLVGVFRREIRTMLILESVLIGLSSTLLGVACGAVLSWILIHVINRQSFGWTIGFAPPWGILAVSVLLTFLATVASGAVSARLGNRMDLAAELQGE